MSKSLRYTVFVTGPDGDTASFGPADGDSVPDWAREQITNPDAWASEDVVLEAPAEDGAGDAAYSGLRKAELEALVDARNAGREDEDQIVVEAPGNKAELAAALEADDAAYA